MTLGHAPRKLAFRFFDKDTFPLRNFKLDDGVRIVPGGSSIRRGAYVATGVVCMPPMYINVGAYIGTGTMIDSHALVGSCAQVGERVHLSAAAQLGGVLEPVNAAPVVIEDDVVVGGNCGVYEGTVVRSRAVIGAGVVLTRGTPVYDLERETIYRGDAERALEIPSGAVVVPGARQVKGGWGEEQRDLASDAGDREVPRREDRQRDRARDLAAMKVRGTIRVPGDKSISHRALICASLATGESRISGILRSEDVESTATVLRSLGASIPTLSDELTIEGAGFGGFREPRLALQCGNSGTTTRLLAGVAAASPFKSRFEGDASLSRRPMKRVAEPLTAMGARFEFEHGDGLPMTVHGGDLAGIAWNTRAASAQTKSAILCGTSRRRRRDGPRAPAVEGSHRAHARVARRSHDDRRDERVADAGVGSRAVAYGDSGRSFVGGISRGARPLWQRRVRCAFPASASIQHE